MIWYITCFPEIKFRFCSFRKFISHEFLSHILSTGCDEKWCTWKRTYACHNLSDTKERTFRYRPPRRFRFAEIMAFLPLQMLISVLYRVGTARCRVILWTVFPGEFPGWDLLFPDNNNICMDCTGIHPYPDLMKKQLFSWLYHLISICQMVLIWRRQQSQLSVKREKNYLWMESIRRETCIGLRSSPKVSYT